MADHPRYTRALKAFDDAPGEVRITEGTAGECYFIVDAQATVVDGVVSMEVTRCGAPYESWEQQIKRPDKGEPGVMRIDGVCVDGHEFHRAGGVSAE